MPTLRRLLSALLMAAMLLGIGACTSSSGSVAPPVVTGIGAFALVGNINSNNINVYAVDPDTGFLIQVPNSPFGAGSGILSMEIHPNGIFVYAGGFTTDQILGFSLNRDTGGLTALNGFPVATVDEHINVIDRTGAFLYAVGETSIDAFTINPGSGALTRINGFPVAVGGMTDAWQAAIDAENRFLYVSDRGSDQIFGFQINQGTGALTPIAPIASGAADPQALGIDPTNRFLYVANGAGSFTAFSINAGTGALAPLAGFPMPFAGAGALIGRFDFRGQFLFVADGTSGTLNAFTINQATGALAQLAGYPVAGVGGASVTFLQNLPFLYVSDRNNDRVRGFVLNANGTVAAVPGSPFATGDGPNEMATLVFSL